MRQCTARVGAPRSEALGTSGCPSACQGFAQSEDAAGAHSGEAPPGPGTGGTGSWCMRSSVMLVESDIREGIRGILP